MTQEQIVALSGPKRIKIFKLHQLGLSNKDIAALLGTNVGHVWNTLKDYRDRPERAQVVDTLTS